MAKAYTREILEAMGIFELRTFARENGVTAPTMVNKEGIIDRLLAVQDGTITPHPPSGRGRPVKPIRTQRPDGAFFGAASPVEQAPNPVGQAVNPVGQAVNPIGQREYEPSPAPILTVAAPEQEQTDYMLEEREGVLEIHNDGYGFIRVCNCEPSEKDAYIASPMIKRLGLRRGDLVKGQVRRARDNRTNGYNGNGYEERNGVRDDSKPMAMTSILTVNGVRADEIGRRPHFEDLTPIYPEQRYNLELPN
ncbi:MAG: hypothetical protein LBS99_07950, partial [Clostridiales bacterium]|nr:hypothetical protein [Clostridiales bacterium]